MTQLVELGISYPAVILTILVGIAVVYWLFVILGALDIDGGHADVDAGLDAGHAGADAAGAHHAGLDGSGSEAVNAGGGGGALTGLMSALGLRDVPLTITLSFIWFFAWVICIVLMFYLGDVTVLPPWLLGALILVASLVLALLPAALAARPLAPIFVIKDARRREDLVGSTCVVTTGSVDGKFGQARVEDGGDVLTIHVRCDREGVFKRNDKALIIDFDTARDAYVIEPMDAVIGRKPPG